MERWTIADVVAAEYRMTHYDGGPKHWCSFDYVLRPAPDVRSIVIWLGQADTVTVRWFPHLERGMCRGLASARTRGRLWAGVSIEIRGIKEHPVATTPEACELYGVSFIHDLQDYGVSLGPWTEELPLKDNCEDRALVTVATYSILPAAQVVQFGLEAEGFQVFLADAEFVTADWLLGNAVGCIKLQVPSNQAEAALAYIERTRATPPTDAGPTCLACGAAFPDELFQCPACGWTYGPPQRRLSN